MSKPYVYATTCVLEGIENTQALMDMTDDAVEVTLQTIRRHCDLSGFESDCRYAVGPERGLHLKDDFHVSYHKSRYKGRPCYYVRHSAIEHIFMRLDDWVEI